jgi:hypothetical protein
LFHQNAVPVEGKGACFVELVGKNAATVGLTVAVGVFQKEEAVGQGGGRSLLGLGPAEDAESA